MLPDHNLLSEKSMFKKYLSIFICLFFVTNVSAENLESLFTAPDVFVTSKIKPATEFDGDRGNILFDSHDLEKKNPIFNWGNVK